MTVLKPKHSMTNRCRFLIFLKAPKKETLQYLTKGYRHVMQFEYLKMLMLINGVISAFYIIIIMMMP